MKPIALLITACASLFFFSSCNKENSFSNNNNTANLPKTYTEDVTSSILGNSKATFNLTYDASDRITGIIPTSSSGEKFIYTYTGNSSFTLDLYSGSTLSIHEILWLNNLPFIDSTFQYNDTNDTTTEKYIYNASKQLVQARTYDYTTAGGATLSDLHNYTYDNLGNVITDAGSSETVTYDYYTDKINTLSLGQPYSTQTKNLIKDETITIGGDTETVTHTYTFDASNRITSDKAVGSNGDIIIKSYTY